MNAFALTPPHDREESPAFRSAAGCRDWLAGLALTNAPPAQVLLTHQLELLSRTSLPLAEYLQILELMRGPVTFVQNECARRFAGKALPLSSTERLAYDSSQALWQLLATNYLNCLQAALDGDAGVVRLAAIIAQRALAATSAALLNHCRAAILPAPLLWRRLHKIYGAAEALQATQQTVKDPQAYGERTNVMAAYVESLLLFAARPYELSQKQLGLVAYWAQRWALKVPVRTVRPVDAKSTPLIVDLASEQPAIFDQGDAAGPERRWLELDGLRRSLRKRLKLLRDGESPESLELGRDCVQPACQALLTQVYRLWCKGQARDSDSTTSERGACHLVAGIEAIHYYISGQIFRQPGHSIHVTKREADEIATFGRISTRHEDGYSQRQGFMLEPWQISSGQGSTAPSLLRPIEQAGARLSAGQLVAVQAAGEPGFMLGVLSWLAVDDEQSTLKATVRVLPGTPVAVALRGTGITALNEKFRQGFRLPAVDRLGEPKSLVMPAGVFRIGRIIEIYSDQARQVRLSRLIARGSNFDRADFEWA